MEQEFSPEFVQECASKYRDLMRRGTLIYDTWERFLVQHGQSLSESGTYWTHGMLLSRSHGLRLPIRRPGAAVDVAWEAFAEKPVLAGAGATEQDVPEIQYCMNEEEVKAFSFTAEAQAVLWLTLMERYSNMTEQWMELLAIWKANFYDANERWSPGITFDLDGTLSQAVYNCEGDMVALLTSRHGTPAIEFEVFPGYEQLSRIAWAEQELSS